MLNWGGLSYDSFLSFFKKFYYSMYKCSSTSCWANFTSSIKLFFISLSKISWAYFCGSISGFFILQTFCNGIQNCPRWRGYSGESIMILSSKCSWCCRDKGLKQMWQTKKRLSLKSLYFWHNGGRRQVWVRILGRALKSSPQ